MTSASFRSDTATCNAIIRSSRNTMYCVLEEKLQVYLEARTVCRTLWPPDLVPDWVKKNIGSPNLVSPEAKKKNNNN